MNKSIKNHRLFNAGDYSYLSGKGYSGADIIKIWDRDEAEGRGATGHENKPWVK